MTHLRVEFPPCLHRLALSPSRHARRTRRSPGDVRRATGTAERPPRHGTGV